MSPISSLYLLTREAQATLRGGSDGVPHRAGLGLGYGVLEGNIGLGAMAFLIEQAIGLGSGLGLGVGLGCDGPDPIPNPNPRPTLTPTLTPTRTLSRAQSNGTVEQAG